MRPVYGVGDLYKADKHYKRSKTKQHDLLIDSRAVVLENLYNDRGWTSIYQAR